MKKKWYSLSIPFPFFSLLFRVHQEPKKTSESSRILFIFKTSEKYGSLSNINSIFQTKSPKKKSEKDKKDVRDLFTPGLTRQHPSQFYLNWTQPNLFIFKLLHASPKRWESNKFQNILRETFRYLSWLNASVSHPTKSDLWLQFFFSSSTLYFLSETRGCLDESIYLSPNE
jgi:hypothetical protein